LESSLPRECVSKIATPSGQLDFDLAARVARKYSYIAKKAAC